MVLDLIVDDGVPSRGAWKPDFCGCWRDFASKTRLSAHISSGFLRFSCCVGHRKGVLDPRYAVVGVAYGVHVTFGRMAALEFARGWEPTAEAVRRRVATGPVTPSKEEMEKAKAKLETAWSLGACFMCGESIKGGKAPFLIIFLVSRPVLDLFPGGGRGGTGWKAPCELLQMRRLLCLLGGRRFQGESLPSILCLGSRREFNGWREARNASTRSSERSARCFLVVSEYGARRVARSSRAAWCPVRWGSCTWNASCVAVVRSPLARRGHRSS